MKKTIDGLGPLSTTSKLNIFEALGINMQCFCAVGLFPKELSWRGRSMELLLAYLPPDPAALGLILTLAIFFQRNDICCRVYFAAMALKVALEWQFSST